MQIASWNVNSLKARWERFEAFVKRTSPDVICLQELKCIDELFPWDAVKALGYEAAVFGQKTYNGVAILSRTPITDIQKGFRMPSEDVQSRWIEGTVNGFRIASSYVPNGQEVGSEKYTYKLSWLSRLEAHLADAAASSTPWILAGDFNIALEDRDVHDPELWRGKIQCSDAERQALNSILKTGFHDLFRKYQTAGGHYTWWDYRGLSFPKNLGLRIDYLFGNAAAVERCRSIQIERVERKGTTPSDHVPVVAVFE